MANKEFHVRRGLIVANTVLVTNGSNVGVNTASPNVSFHVVANDAIIIPVGTTAQRPTAVPGLLRYNTDTSDLEFYVASNTAWKSVKSIADASAANSTSASLGSVANTHVLFDDQDAFGGSAGFTFNKTTNNVTIGNTVTVTTSGSFGGSVANSSGMYTAGVVNAAQHTIGSTLIANTLGVYHTGVMNAASHSVGTTTVANSTGVWTSGTVNGAVHSIGSTFVANTLGAYHTGTMNAASYTVGSNFIANTLGAYHTGTINAASHTIGSAFVANTLGVYHTGTVNAAIGIFGGNIIANTTRFAIGSTIGFQANGSLGTAGQMLTSNGSTVYWSTPSAGVTSVASGDGLTGGPITGTGTLSVVGGSGLVSNSSGVHVGQGTGITVSSTTVAVNASYIATISANNASFLGGVAAANYARTDTTAAFTGLVTVYASSTNGLRANSASSYGIIGYTGSTTLSGILGYSQDQTKYGRLGHSNAYGGYFNGDVHCVGSITASSNITAYFSDRRLKKNIRPVMGALKMLREITGVYFEQNEVAAKYGYKEGEKHIGVIAQEVENVIPEAISHAPFDRKANGDGTFTSESGEWYKTVDMTKIIPVLIEAIKELEDRINNGY